MWVIGRIIQIAGAVDHRDLRDFCRKLQQLRKAVLQRKGAHPHSRAHTHREIQMKYKKCSKRSAELTCELHIDLTRRKHTQTVSEH